MREAFPRCSPKRCKIVHEEMRLGYLPISHPFHDGSVKHPCHDCKPQEEGLLITCTLEYILTHP